MSEEKLLNDYGRWPTCLIMIVDDGKAARFPLAPAASKSAASPQALPTQRVKIGGFTYLLKFENVQQEQKIIKKGTSHQSKTKAEIGSQRNDQIP